MSRFTVDSKVWTVFLPDGGLVREVRVAATSVYSFRYVTEGGASGWLRDCCAYETRAEAVESAKRQVQKNIALVEEAIAALRKECEYEVAEKEKYIATLKARLEQEAGE